MIEVVGDILAMPDRRAGGVAAVCIPTNGIVKVDGLAVMGKGLAKQAVDRWPDLARVLGAQLHGHGNHTYLLTSPTNQNRWPSLADAPWHIVALPTKHHWRYPSPVDLVVTSVRELRVLVDRELAPDARVALPRAGCGTGGLDWAVMKPLLQALLPEDRWLIVERSP